MHGIYKYEVDGEVIYIGKTNSDFAARIMAHGSEEAFAPYRSNAKIFVFETKSACETEFLETLLINQYKPKLNVAKMGLTDVEVFANFDWEPWDSESKEKYKQTKGFRRVYGLIQPSLYKKVSDYAKAHGTSYNAIVNELLEKFIEEKGL